MVAATGTKRADGRVHGALAREMLKARSHAERNAILAARQVSAHSAWCHQKHAMTSTDIAKCRISNRPIPLLDG